MTAQVLLPATTSLSTEVFFCQVECLSRESPSVTVPVSQGKQEN